MYKMYKYREYTFEELLKELAVFKDAKLNEQQQIAYDRLRPPLW